MKEGAPQSLAPDGTHSQPSRVLAPGAQQVVVPATAAGALMAATAAKALAGGLMACVA